MKSVRAFCLRGGWIGRLATVSLGMLTAATWMLPPGAAGAANLYDSAKKEGKVVVYTYTPIPILQVFLQEFEKQYPGVKTEYYRARGNQVLNRFLDESRVGKHVADVAILSGEQTHVMAQKKLLAKYQSPECANYPATFKDKDGHGCAAYLLPKVLAYNPKLVPADQIPKRWEELVHPKWKGKIATDPQPIEWYGALLDIMGEEKGRAYFRGLAQQNMTFRTGFTLVADMVAAGESAVALTLNGDTISEMKRKGASIDFAVLDPYVVVLTPAVISAKAPHPNAARLLVDYALSEAGQRVWAREGRVPARPGVESLDPRLVRGVKMIPTDASNADKWNELAKELREIWKVRAR